MEIEKECRRENTNTGVDDVDSVHTGNVIEAVMPSHRGVYEDGASSQFWPYHPSE